MSDLYVSRGGEKLSGALKTFSLSTKDKVCWDIGSSTGGFTDCLIQEGASSVWAIDVGYGLFDYTLKKNPKVHLLERTNFRYIEPEALPEKPQIVTIDVSFISLDKILLKLKEFITTDTEIIALVKPQFEGTPKEVPGGFVKDEPTRQAIISRVREAIQTLGYTVCAEADSVIKGRKGNQETFFCLKITSGSKE